MTAEQEAKPVERRRPETARQRAWLVYVVWRPLMFVAWMAVFWGTAVALAALYVFVARGPQAALAVLLPRPPLGLVNTALAVVALIVWIGAIVVSRRRHG